MNKTGKYIPPKNKNIKPPHTKSMIIKRNKPVTLDFKSSNSFPTLSSTNIIKHQDNPFNMVCFADIASGVEIAKKVVLNHNPIMPGWVRLSRSTDGRTIDMRGDRVPTTFNNNEDYKLILQQSSIIKQLERNELLSFEHGREQYIHLSNLDYENSFYIDEDEDDGSVSDIDFSLD
jgi:hypothetical protein